MASERPPFDMRPRAMTPLAEFDSRQKIPVADPLEGIPRLRPVANLGFAALERATRDTDVEELTPAERPFEIRVEQRLEKLEKLSQKHDEDLELIKKTGREAAQHALETHQLMKAINDRMRWFEIEHKWVPRLAWLLTTAIAVLALIRTYR